MFPPVNTSDVVYGWVSGSDVRGSRDIIWSSLSTIWLCTWTCLCLNMPAPLRRKCHGCHHLHSLLYKFRWQLFAVFFPEVLVATAAEQWLSARQTARAFRNMGCQDWTITHSFFADMGGVLVSSPPGDGALEPFPADSQQLAYLVRHGYLAMPAIPKEEIKALNKADGLARLVTLVQMVWFTANFILRCVQGLGVTTLEVTTLAFILCTLHTFAFWYNKPLDPEIRKVLPLSADIKTICQQAGHSADHYAVSPLDFVHPPPDPRSLMTPFWFGLMAVFGKGHFAAPAGQRKNINANKKGRVGKSRQLEGAERKQEAHTPSQSLPNSRVLPPDGVGYPLMLYLLAFQGAYYGLHIGFAWVAAFPSRVEWYLWTVSSAADGVLVGLYFLSVLAGTYLSPFLGRWLFQVEAKGIIDVALLLPPLAKVGLHGSAVLLYGIPRLAVLAESMVSLRALPASVYVDVEWAGILPHV